MNRFKKLYLIPLIFLVLGSLSYYVYINERTDVYLHVYFLSLERGRSLVMKTPDKKYIVIGGGQNTEVMRELTKILPFYRRDIDTIIIPHAHENQIGGLLDIIDRYSINNVIIPRVHATSTVLSVLMKKVYEKKIHVQEVERGDEVYLSEDVKLQILFPYEGFSFNKTSTPELGMRLEYGKTTLYILGNLSRTIQKDIFTYLHPYKEFSVIEFFHTGSPAKVYKDLIDALNPYFIFTTRERTTRVFSDGEVWRR